MEYEEHLVIAAALYPPLLHIPVQVGLCLRPHGRRGARGAIIVGTHALVSTRAAAPTAHGGFARRCPDWTFTEFTPNGPQLIKEQCQQSSTTEIASPASLTPARSADAR